MPGTIFLAIPDSRVGDNIVMVLTNLYLDSLYSVLRSHFSRFNGFHIPHPIPFLKVTSSSPALLLSSSHAVNCQVHPQQSGLTYVTTKPPNGSFSML
jgi:hypothetical protein